MCADKKTVSRIDNDRCVVMSGLLRWTSRKKHINQSKKERGREKFNKLKFSQRECACGGSGRMWDVYVVGYEDKWDWILGIRYGRNDGQ